MSTSSKGMGAKGVGSVSALTKHSAKQKEHSKVQQQQEDEEEKHTEGNASADLLAHTNTARNIVAQWLQGEEDDSDGEEEQQARTHTASYDDDLAKEVSRPNRAGVGATAPAAPSYGGLASRLTGSNYGKNKDRADEEKDRLAAEERRRMQQREEEENAQDSRTFLLDRKAAPGHALLVDRRKRKLADILGDDKPIDVDAKKEKMRRDRKKKKMKKKLKAMGLTGKEAEAAAANGAQLSDGGSDSDDDGDDEPVVQKGAASKPAQPATVPPAVSDASADEGEGWFIDRTASNSESEAKTAERKSQTHKQPPPPNKNDKQSSAPHSHKKDASHTNRPASSHSKPHHKHDHQSHSNKPSHPNQQHASKVKKHVDGEGRVRTKKRSKQKNLKKDHRPDHLKPAVNTQS